MCILLCVISSKWFEGNTCLTSSYSKVVYLAFELEMVSMYSNTVQYKPHHFLCVCKVGKV